MAHERAEGTATIQHRPLEGLHTIFVVIFFVFLLLALVGQTFAWNWRTWLPGAEGTQSMLGGVKSAVYTVISQLS